MFKSILIISYTTPSQLFICSYFQRTSKNIEDETVSILLRKFIFCELNNLSSVYLRYFVIMCRRFLGPKAEGLLPGFWDAVHCSEPEALTTISAHVLLNRHQCLCAMLIGESQWTRLALRAGRTHVAFNLDKRTLCLGRLLQNMALHRDLPTTMRTKYYRKRIRVQIILITSSLVEDKLYITIVMLKVIAQYSSFPPAL